MKKRILLTAFSLLTPFALFAPAEEMTLKEAQTFIDGKDYLACKSDDECILTNDACGNEVSVHKDKQTDYDKASKTLGRNASCPVPAGRMSYHSSCQSGKCKAMLNTNTGGK